MLYVTGVYLRAITNMIFFSFVLDCKLSEHLLFYSLSFQLASWQKKPDNFMPKP